MKIVIETIPHDQQRYPTVGDYWIAPDGTIQIRVSEIGNSRFEALVAVHELVELLICKAHDIDFATIDYFDKEYEKNRKPGDCSEPGDSPRAPYHSAHRVATFVEAGLAEAMMVNWHLYNRRVEEL